MRKILKRLSIAAPCGNYEAITAILAREITYGWEESEDGGECRWSVHCENGDFLERLASEISRLFPAAALTLKDVENRDWTTAWREFFTPVKAGRFTVLPPWLADNSPSSILVEPKSAFGTGHHASTRLCLMAISRLDAQGRIKPGDTFLDLGCGTGILAIASVKCGLSGLAIDNDPLALENALENIALNKCPGTRLVAGSIEKAGGEVFNLVTANILAGPLIEMARDICAVLAPRGSLVLSGILDRQANDVANAYMACGLPQPALMDDGEWRALLFEKN